MVHKALERVASGLRRERVHIDPSIPTGYLLSLIVERMFELARGAWMFRSARGRLFVGRRATIKARQKIRHCGVLRIGRDAYIDALSSEGVILGKGFSLGRGATIECTGALSTLGRGLWTADNVGIGSFSFLGCAGGVRIGENTIFGNFVSVHSENHNFDSPGTPIRLQGVTHRGILIGRNCWIGAKATILDGTQLGDNCIVAAGAVLRAGDYPSNTIYGGVPARAIGSVP